MSEVSINSKFQKHHTGYIITLLFIFFLLLAAVTPLSGDDWTWSSAIGLRRLATGFIGYNGRLVSNVLEIIITRSFLIRVLLYATLSTTLIELTTKIIFNKQPSKFCQYLFTTGLYLTISTQVYSQTFGWFAGFINYIFGMLPIFFFIYWTITRKTTSEKTSTISLVGLLLTGLIASLIIENVTIYSVLLAIGTLIYFFKKNKSKLSGALAYTLGTILGAIIMFSNPIYISALSGNNNFRHVSFGSGMWMKVSQIYTTAMYKYVFQENGIILLIISICLIVCLWKKRSNLFGIIYKALLTFILFSYSFFSAFIRNLLPSTNFDPMKVSNILAILSIIFVVSLCLSLIFISSDLIRWKLFFYILSALVLSAPFAVITPYGPRCAFATICFMILATLELVNYVFTSEKEVHNINISKLVLTVFGSFSMIFLLGVMSANGYVNHVRTTSINQQLRAGHKTIYVSMLPFQQYTWDTSPNQTRFQHKIYMERMHMSADSHNLVFVPFKDSRKY